jgi:signal transduction histidine kinase
MEARFKAMGVDLRWSNHGLPDSLQIVPHTGLQVLRILQEALTNVVKHARASMVDVRLTFSPDSIDIRIADDGVGFGGQVSRAGRGLDNMRTRAKKIGAWFDIEHLSVGTAVHLKLPLQGGANPV